MASKKKKSKKKEESKAPPAQEFDEFMDYAEPTVEEIEDPEHGQLQLTDAELAEAVTKVLTAADPNACNSRCQFQWGTGKFTHMPPSNRDMLAVHFDQKGSVFHIDSEDAKAQLAAKQAAEDRIAEERRKLKQSGDEESIAAATEGGKNQFNYSERAAQTFNNPMRSRGVSTEPPPMNTIGATVTQWDIYDSYMEVYENALREQQMEKNKVQGMRKEGGQDDASNSNKDDDVIHSAAMGRSLKILERMVNQNEEDEIFQDFKYWEDQSDQFRDGEGSLLPLWRFSTERTKRKQVTSICWNPKYPDLFAVGYGSYDFMRQGSGMVCCFSLKNTAHPEYSFSTESGIMCLDFHPQHAALLAVGCYDGTVMVFDVRNKVNKPIYVSTIKTGKHTDPVWQTVWQEEDIAKELNFFSISSDGRVANWIMSKNTEFKMEDIMQLKLVSSQKDEPEEETSLTGLAGGCCFDFNKVSEHLFIVGTEEGKIHKCSKAYSGQYLETYEGHHMAVYAVKWNPYHPRVFVSCSADWTVKLWDHQVPYPMMSFDLFNAVGDVAWAPYSSTVFAAVTSDGKVHVFDLNENKHEPLCEQKVVKRARLTHVMFNKRDPIILVGDDRGGVNSLKLSPNLRKLVEKSKDQNNDDEDDGKGKRKHKKKKKKKKKKDAGEGEKGPSKADLEIAKIDKLLSSTDAEPRD